MYQVTPPAVYVHESVYGSPEARARMKRMLAAMDAPPPVAVTDADLNRLCAEGDWEMKSRRLGQIDRTGDPVVIFNTFRWHTPDQVAAQRRRYPHLADGYLGGWGQWGFRDGRATLASHRGVCQNAWELHSAWGCLHRCDYCSIGRFLNIMVNLEEWLERLDALVRDNEWLKLFKYDNHTDTITFEPEYGASALLVDYFSRRPDQYLMLYTKSDNVDHLLGLDHRGRTIVCWTLSCDTVTRLVEKNSPSMARRIAAAEKCQQAGYPVRVRFSPIVPIRHWREENAAMLEEYLSRVRPDIITIDTFKWLAPEVVGDIMDLSLWDGEYRGCVEHYQSMAPAERPVPIIPQGKQLFSDEARAAIYRFFISHIRDFNQHVPIALCGETPEMWDLLADELHMTPENYVCCCGPTSTPDHPLVVGIERGGGVA